MRQELIKLLFVCLCVWHGSATPTRINVQQQTPQMFWQVIQLLSRPTSLTVAFDVFLFHVSCSFIARLFYVAHKVNYHMIRYGPTRPMNVLCELFLHRHRTQYTKKNTHTHSEKRRKQVMYIYAHANNMRASR